MFNDKKDSVKRVNDYIKKNKVKPNYVVYGGKKVLINDYIKLDFMNDALSRINKFIKKNNKYPNYVDIKGIKVNTNEYKSLFNNKIYKVSTKKSDAGDYDNITKYFRQVFGNYKTFDDALKLVNNRGYSYYYDDVYSNKDCIDRIKSKKGINCADSCQLFWHIAKSLNFEPTLYHVKCSGGGGHVYLRLDKDGKTYYRDPACVLSNNERSITDIWCRVGSGGVLLDKDPKWFMSTVNK